MIIRFFRFFKSAASVHSGTAELRQAWSYRVGGASLMGGAVGAVIGYFVGRCCRGCHRVIELVGLCLWGGILSGVRAPLNNRKIIYFSNDDIITL